MSLGGIFDSTSSATDKRIAATDQAKVLQGGSAYTESGAVSVGKGGKLNLAPDLSKAKIGAGATVTFGDGGAAATALAASFNDTLKQVVAQNTQTLSSAVSSQADQTKTLAGSITDALKQSLGNAAGAAQTAATGGVNDLSKTFLYLVAGVLGLGAFYIWRTRK